ncbi:hypothetical protein Gpo141_00013588 [Globisporangium polare]
MKTFALATAAVVALQANTALGFWDNGHMLVGEVASQLMATADRTTIETVLHKWDEDFPNTNKISTAAIWPDLIKCSKSSASCTTPVLPSFTQMEKWHFVNLPLNVNGSKWGGQEPDLNLFKSSFGGEATDVLEKSMTAFVTTKSFWAVNLMLRNLIHILGDLHQPLHVVAAVSETNPLGDQGGNLYKFATPCANANLHALWDASGGEYLNNWSPNTTAIAGALAANATALIKALPANADAINFTQYKSLSYADFVSAVTSKALYREVILESYKLSTSAVYPKLNLTYNADGLVACPSEEYFTFAKTTMKTRIAIAGQRLSVVLTQLARQLRTLGLAK